MTMKARNHQPQEKAVDGLNIAVEKVAADLGLLYDSVEIARDAAATLGIMIRHPTEKDVLKVTPITLFPTLVPQSALNEILLLQWDINLLMHRLAHDRLFLESSLCRAASVDLFLQNLFAIYNQVDITSQWELGLIRSDYILSRLTGSFQQVEVNMICVGLSAIGSKVGLVHQKVLQFMESDLLDDLPPATGESLALYGEGLRMAYEVYTKYHWLDRKRSPVLLIVIHDGHEFNIMDQKQVQFATGIIALRRSFRQIAETAYLDEKGCLFVEGREIAIVYYRTGYSPDQYKERAWEMRLLMEKSNAVKCPSVAHQLAGSKKIQQVLCRPEVLRGFVPNEQIVARMQRTFVGQWDLSEEDAKEKIEEAIKEPEKFVLKPNREGGGNNIYGHDIVTKIQVIRDTPQAQEYILMELIQPVLQDNVFVRAEMTPTRLATISEVGVFGAILARNGEVIFNKMAREVLLRSKGHDSREGGLAMGHACLGSVVTF